MNLIIEAQVEHEIKERKATNICHLKQALSAKEENLKQLNVHIRKAACVTKISYLTKIIGDNT